MHNHLRVGPICLPRLTYQHFTLRFLNILPKYLKGRYCLIRAIQQLPPFPHKSLETDCSTIFSARTEPCLGSPKRQQFHALEHLFHAVRRISVKLDVLHLGKPFVPCLEFPVVAGKCIHIVQPPERRHYLQAPFGFIIAHHAERQPDMHLGRIGTLGKKGK